MKKLLITLGLLCSAAFAFANTEIDVNFYGTLFDKGTLKTDDDKSLDFKQGFAFGGQDDFSFFYGERESKFDAGLSFYANYDFFSKAEIEDLSFEGSGFNFGMGIGPVFRITFGNPFSLFLRPTLGFKLGFLDVGDVLTYTNWKLVDFDFLVVGLNVGGRTWLLNTNGFHLGLSYGMILDFNGGFAGWAADYKDSYGYGYTKSDSEGYTKTSVDMKLYLGVCFNFGDRGIDRMSAKEE